MNRRSLAFGLALFSLSSFSLFATQTNSETIKKFPGIFIADSGNRWHIPGSASSPEEQLGYVICDGGYLGSPIIPNERKIVDQFLAGCTTKQRIGPGKLPVVNVSANHKKSSSGYPAYAAKFNGQTYYLCHGFLNSSNWCSYEAEKKAVDLVAQIRRGENIQTAQVNFPAPPAQKNEFEHELLNGRPYPSPMVDEIAREIAQTIQPRIQTPLESKRAIQVTREEYEALQKGQTSLDELASGRQIVSLNGQNEPNSILQQAQMAEKIKLDAAPVQSQTKAITINESQLAALKSGQLSINDLLAGQAISQSAPVNSLGSSLSSLPPELAQVVAQIKPLALNGSVQNTAAMPQVVNFGSANMPNGTQFIPLTPGGQGSPSIAPEQIAQIASQFQGQSSIASQQMQIVGMPQQAQAMQIPQASPQIIPISQAAQAPSVSPELIAQVIAQVQAMQMQRGQMPPMTEVQQMQPMQAPMQMQPTQIASYSNQPYAPNPGYMMPPSQPNYYGYGVPSTQAVTNVYGTHANTMYWPGYAGWY